MSIGRLTQFCTRPITRVWRQILNKPQSNAGTLGGLPVHQLSVQTAPPPFTHPPSEVLRLLICLDKGTTHTQLHRKEVQHYSSDRDLFAGLRREYWDWRKPKTWFTLRGISRLALCRVRESESDSQDGDRQKLYHKHSPEAISSFPSIPATSQRSTSTSTPAHLQVPKVASAYRHCPRSIKTNTNAVQPRRIPQGKYHQ